VTKKSSRPAKESSQFHQSLLSPLSFWQRSIPFVSFANFCWEFRFQNSHSLSTIGGRGPGRGGFPAGRRDCSRLQLSTPIYTYLHQKPSRPANRFVVVRAGSRLNRPLKVAAT